MRYRNLPGTDLSVSDIGFAAGDNAGGLKTDQIRLVASALQLGINFFDEAFDRRVLDAISTGDGDTLRGLPPQALRSGSSEILNWVLVAGACAELSVSSCAYLPVRRTPAGTGVGLGFVIWEDDK